MAMDYDKNKNFLLDFKVWKKSWKSDRALLKVHNPVIFFLN